MSEPVLVTGAAGFIGAAVCGRLLERGERVVGLDNLNSYYDPALKQARLARLERLASSQANRAGTGSPAWSFQRLDLADGEAMAALFASIRPRAVVHLAAQAGVRYSLENPAAYIQANLVGFGHILEGCRHYGAGHLVYASSSSVYGGNRAMPFAEGQPVNHPVSLYAATKKANELMAHTYSHLYGLPATGLRFFTVYGPWGRPDMAPMLFAKAILAGQPIKVFNNGQMRRDFTYIDDIVTGVVACLDKPATADPAFDAARPDPATSWAPHRMFNIGNAQPIELLHFIGVLEQALGRKAIQDLQPMQPGDVEVGVERFAHWYREFYGSV
ncbi:MAG: NAD-dependent epimerase/dehydratase family protein [Synechococcaceae bacterium WB9_2_170]|nr:NAD-dependent epimerase/dehydratase family protein [Synechococcaceae bacterium WB9_2_170]